MISINEWDVCAVLVSGQCQPMRQGPKSTFLTMTWRVFYDDKICFVAVHLTENSITNQYTNVNEKDTAAGEDSWASFNRSDIAVLPISTIAYTNKCKCTQFLPVTKSTSWHFQKPNFNCHSMLCPFLFALLLCLLLRSTVNVEPTNVHESHVTGSWCSQISMKISNF